MTFTWGAGGTVEALDVTRHDVGPFDEVPEGELLLREAGKVDETVLLLTLDFGLVTNLQEEDSQPGERCFSGHRTCP